MNPDLQKFVMSVSAHQHAGPCPRESNPGRPGQDVSDLCDNFHIQRLQGPLKCCDFSRKYLFAYLLRIVIFLQLGVVLLTGGNCLHRRADLELLKSFVP